MRVSITTVKVIYNRIQELKCPLKKHTKVKRMKTVRPTLFTSTRTISEREKQEIHMPTQSFS